MGRDRARIAQAAARLIAEHGQLGWPAPVCGVMAP